MSEQLKRQISEMSTWCDYDFPILGAAAKWLLNIHDYPSQGKGAFGSIGDFREYLRDEYTPEEKSPWISCEDRLPEGSCLVITEKRERISLRMHTASYEKNITIIGNHFEFDMPPVTHWMPLPEPPEEP